MTPLEATHAFILTALLVAASVTDVRDRRIPNIIPLSILIVEALCLAAGLQDRPVDHAVSLGIGVIVGIGFFLARLWGGGDCKLFAAVSFALVPGQWPIFVLGVALAGGLLALPYLANSKWRQDARDRGLPYAIAIGLGAAVAAYL